ncbi:MAG: hypothetical protein KKG33_05195 [candidate division Zixibacteria bacterium]|nr:hypothetical protein [candidate division Zixibacteria bacterium]MBU1471237.1 hypothetical protein [candidate division Zixibacteria bacterium]MBU2624939.1 hypothetical protein [candidate division Zixibacteria bacterium]
MVQNESKESSAEGSDLRYKYIGFDVYGSKVKKFFKSEEEKKLHEQAVEDYGKSHYSSIRSGTEVAKNLLPTSNKIVLTLTSLGLIAGSLLPWFSVSSIYGDRKIVGVTTFSAISDLMGVLSNFSGMFAVLVYVFTGLAVASVLFGVLTLVMLYMPSKDREAGLSRLKHVLGWQYLPLIAWFGLFAYLIVGITIPFGEEISNIYMVRGLGPRFNIVTFWAFAQPALWLTFASLIVNCVKSNDL